MFRRFAIALTIILASAFTGKGQDKVVVYQKDGDVKVCSYGSSQWRSVELKEVIGLHDRISIPKSGSVRLLVSSTNRVYLSPQTGEFGVDEVIAAAEKKANEVMSNLNQKISDSKKGGPAIPKYSSFGATTRGIGEGSSYADSLYSAVVTFFTSDEIDGLVDDKVTLTRKDDGDGIFHFIVRNKGDRDLYTCIIRSTESGISVTAGPDDGEGFPEMIAAHSRQDRTMQSYADDGESDYFLLCSPEPFSAEVLNEMLKSFPANSSAAPATGVSFSAVL